MRTSQPLIEARKEQMFPTLDAAEIDRLRRFGVVRSYAAGETLSRIGESGHGMNVVLCGEVESRLESAGGLSARS